MAFTKLVSLIAFASCALLLSSNSFGVNAVAIENHGHLAARHHALGQSMALKKRSTNNSGRCKPRPTTSSESTSSKPTSSAESSSKASTTSSQAQTSSTKATSTTSAKATETSTSSSGSSGPNAGNSGNTMRGLAWAVDNSFAPTIAHQPQISWYYHWNDGTVPQLSNLEFVPMLWGSNDVSTFNSILSSLDGNPSHMVGPNEPDLASQSNLSPHDAADLWMQQIAPWGKKGVQLGSPAIAFDLNWMQQFLDAINAQGGYVDFVCLHWYGDAKNIDQLMSYVEQAHSQFGKPLWVTEIGVTTSSEPTDASTLSFMQNVIHQFEGLGYVERIAWFGDFLQSQPIDDFASATNSFFASSTELTALGNWYANSG